MATEYVFGPLGITRVNKAVTETENNFDIISALPLEISTMIFRLLDPAAMNAAMLVRKNWYSIYQSDPIIKRFLRRRVRRSTRERYRLAGLAAPKRRTRQSRDENKRRAKKARIDKQQLSSALMRTRSMRI
ncbi:hypothetical protein U1Q18_046555 [Sarracenia purpurea var. burkii]